MKLSSTPLRFFAAALFLSALSCTENLDSSGACAVLCPPVGGDVQNETFNAVSLDTTVQALSGLGTETGLLLASRGDTLDTRAVVRFDSLPTRFTPTGDSTQNIKTVDSAFILLKLDTLSIKGTAPLTIEAYDVDTTANDTSTTAILALFRPDRFISSQAFARTDLKDTLRYYISNAAILQKIQAGARLRVGLRSVSSGSTQIRIIATEGLTGPQLSFRATADTATHPLTVTPLSKTPVGESLAAAHLADYTVIAKAPPPGSAADLDVGGLPARRVYLRFDIPSRIVDSTTVIRATLLLNQIANPALDPTDVVDILPHVVLATTAVADPSKASQIIADISTDTLRVKPGESGLRQLELARAFSVWRTQDATTTPRAIVLSSVAEGNTPLEIRFYSSEAAASLRPQLRISYTSKVPLGLP
ncbi:MAG TPA: hypothetical protein VGO75_06425 [Gemmatimonadaceae bacterium]|nr:hypothetical protein [Gemmatimonadaceae bacterium]